MYARAIIEESSIADAVTLDIWSNKTWFRKPVPDYDIDAHEYIGVTPNKQYTINLQAESRMGSATCYISISIKYSPEINKQTPTITDY